MERQGPNAVQRPLLFTAPVLAALWIVAGCSGSGTSPAWTRAPEDVTPWRADTLPGRVPVYKMWARVDRCAITLPAHNLGGGLPGGGERVLSKERSVFVDLPFRAWTPGESGGEAGDESSDAWRTSFPLPNLVLDDGTLLPDAPNALRLQVDGEDYRFVRYISPAVHPPGRWGYRDGDLVLTVPIGERPHAVTVVAEQTRRWHARWARALWEGDDLDFVRRAVEIDNDLRRALYLPAPAEIEDHLVIPPGSRLELAVGLRPVPALDPGDGVRFLGTFTESATGTVHTLVDVVQDPRTPAGRRWRDISVDLGSLGGKAGVLAFRTMARGDSRFDLAAVAHPRIMPVRRRPGAPRNLLLVVVDTLRGDYLSAAGGPVPTPNLDRLARNGWWFPNAVSASCWTGPSMAALFSGHYPGWFGKANFMVNPPGGFGEVPLLFDILEERGWVTWGIQTNPVLKGRGWRRGLEACRFMNDALGEEVTRRAVAWISRRGGEPFVAYVHYMDPHLPYRFHSPWCGDDVPSCPESGAIRVDASTRALAQDLEAALAERGKARDTRAGLFAHRDLALKRVETPLERAMLRRLYQGEVQYVDYQIGRLLDALRDSGHRDDTVVVVVSDHGEELWDHGGFEHGHSFHREVSGIVLLVDPPPNARRNGSALPGGRAGAGGSVFLGRGRTDRPASIIDVLPTLMRLLGIPVTLSVPGQDLLDPAGSGDRFLFGENVLYGPPQHAVYHGDWVMIHQADETPRLFDRARDPGETKDLAAAHADVVEALTRAHAEHLETCARDGSPGRGGGRSGGTETLDPATRDQLRALGYLQ